MAGTTVVISGMLNTSSIAQSEQRLHASLQAAVPEEPYAVEIGVQID